MTREQAEAKVEAAFRESAMTLTGNMRAPIMAAMASLLLTTRREALEEAAKRCETLPEWGGSNTAQLIQEGCARAIRELAKEER